MLVDWPKTNPTLYSVGNNNCGINRSNNSDNRPSIICNGMSEDDTSVRNTSIKYSNDNSSNTNNRSSINAYNCRRNRSNKNNHNIGINNSSTRDDYNRNISRNSNNTRNSNSSIGSTSNRRSSLSNNSSKANSSNIDIRHSSIIWYA